MAKASTLQVADQVELSPTVMRTLNTRTICSTVGCELVPLKLAVSHFSGAQ